ncbi:phosphocholine cytidylyltransferase family protein [Candidatus Wolfebacteria bacterium]|nr:phosphocholine cytidylyltransferase family protein [Candidatus Wolfebacteria bacterium]
MKAIILAGGQAVRLHPITHHLPKCLLTVGTRTVLDFQLDTLADNDIKEVIIVTGYGADAIREHVSRCRTEPHITFVHNESYATTRAAYGLWVAREHFTEPMIYLNGDLVCDPLIFKKLIECTHPSATAIHRSAWDEEEVNVIVDGEEHVTEIGKQIPEERSWGEFIGATKFSKEFLDNLIQVLDQSVSQGNTNIFAADAINITINDFGQTMHALDITKYLAIEIDTIQDFEEGKRLWKDYEEGNKDA